MEETPVSLSLQRPHLRQPISVPFLWEEKPGKPKKDWKPEASLVLSVPIPVKLIASVPFKWEEKPGIPRSNFLQNPLVSSNLYLSPPPPKIISFSSSSSCSSNPFDDSSLSTADSELSIKFQKQSSLLVSEDETEEYDYSEDNSDDDDTQEFDLETFSFHSDDTFHSAPSLLANQLTTTQMMSSAIPVPSSGLQENNQDAIQAPNSSLSAISDGESTLLGDGITKDLVLEFLFPLFSPRSGFLDRVAAMPTMLTRENDDWSLMGRKGPTLGELIMLSRMLSHGRKVIPIKKQKHSLDGIRKIAFARCLFGTSGKRTNKSLSSQPFRNRQILGQQKTASTTRVPSDI
ncbi:uncharacterized protein [Aristolochia californica]|uniref:uncharacterized protein n=1 Tax=Aristolochia californica TaxID=171875 RepID=UPI0035E2EAF4